MPDGETPSLRNLVSFGDVAAEDDAILDYFVATDAVDKIKDNRACLVLGRKGSGKTALVRHFSEGDNKTLSRPLSLRVYPWSLHAHRIDRGASAHEAYVSSWRYVIATQLSCLALRVDRVRMHDDARRLEAFLVDNYGGISPDLDSILRPRRLRLTKLSFNPTVLGNSLGAVDLERGNQDLQFGLELNALSDAIIESVKTLVRIFQLPRIMVHFDELDQGLVSLDDQRKQILVGLILAATSIYRECRDAKLAIAPIVYLRSDIWNVLQFSDKNKLTQSLALNLEWKDGSLKELINTRLQAKVARTAEWESISEDDLMRGSQTKCNHILARTFLRPRDVIQFLNAALAEAKKRSAQQLIFINKDIVNARDQYSRYLKQELDDEILPHWRHWEEALQACSSLQKMTFRKEDFANEYLRRRSSQNSMDTDEALAKLYGFSVIGYERRSGYGGTSWAFQYADPELGWDSAATRFKVHLGLKEYAKLREERRLGM